MLPQSYKNPVDIDPMQHNTLPINSKKRPRAPFENAPSLGHKEIFMERSETPKTLRQRGFLNLGMAPLFLLGLAWGLCGFFVSAARADLHPKEKKRAQQLTENLLEQLEAQRYDQVIQQLHPSLRRTLTVEQLGEYIERIFRITGPYKKNTLRFQSELEEGDRLRLMWTADFAKDRATVMILLYRKTWQLGGFVIQSPRIQGRLRKEVPLPLPKGARRKRLERAITFLMEGYNQGDWAKFSRPCGEVMRVAMRPPRFALIRRGLLQRFGLYQDRKLLSAHRLLPEGHLILRYQARFQKEKRLVLQVIFAKQQGGDVILWWQLRPYPTRQPKRRP